MANPKPNTENLISFETPWIKIPSKARKTVRVRIPEDLVEEVLVFAHQLDAKKHGQQN